MTELRPYPLAYLARKMFREVETRQSIFNLPASKFFSGSPNHDFGVRFAGDRAATPLGPAAGPHTQMAQNIVLSYLAGGRIFELKTVQILDELKIPRPCIDMQTVGFNVEWSQELKIEQSLEEYVKAAMLLRMLEASGKVVMSPGAGDWIMDLSVGYDLAGIKTERVRGFISGMQDATETVNRLRAELVSDLAPYRDLDFRTQLSHSLTLSTFHGCPPGEVESIVSHLLQVHGLDCIVKLNPTLLGPDKLRELLAGKLAYPDLHVPETAFQKDMQWDQMVDIIGRLKTKAAALGHGLGVKFSNTLIVENHKSFFPVTEKEMYLSGPPLHVLAMTLVHQFRETFGAHMPVSFSAGIDNKNFADAVALGLVPVTVCSDLLHPGGYGRAQTYFKELIRRMDAVSAADIDTFVLKAYGHAATALSGVAITPDVADMALQHVHNGTDVRQVLTDAQFSEWLTAARLLNTRTYTSTLADDGRYGWESNRKPPRRLDSHLVLFDCVTCDKCIPVCPNDANFAFKLPTAELLSAVAEKQSGQWTIHTREPLKIKQKHQIGNFADFCNECGNCDIFCPELGGPYKIKPRFFRSYDDWKQFGDGFYLTRAGDKCIILGRAEGQEFEVSWSKTEVQYKGVDFDVTFDEADVVSTLQGSASSQVDLTWCSILLAVAKGILAEDNPTYVNVGAQ
ncbi:MAG: glutamate synthase [Myxococcales bacterium]|nr:glutamate synthase [Myxococcales bacterium]